MLHNEFDPWLVGQSCHLGRVDGEDLDGAYSMKVSLNPGAGVLGLEGVGAHVVGGDDGEVPIEVAPGRSEVRETWHSRSGGGSDRHCAPSGSTALDGKAGQVRAGTSTPRRVSKMRDLGDVFSDGV